MKIGVTPFPSIGLGRRTTTTTTRDLSKLITLQWNMAPLPGTHTKGSKDNSLQVVELSGQLDLHILSTHPFIRIPSSWKSSNVTPIPKSIQFLLSWHATADRTSQADMLCGWHYRVGIKISELEHKVNTYFTEVSCFLRIESLLISAPKLSVILFTPDPAQANTHSKIKIEDSELPLVRSPKLLWVYLDILFLFNTHYIQVTNQVSKRINVLNALTGTNWWQKKETLLMTYKAPGRSIANYAAHVWSKMLANLTYVRYSALRMRHIRIVTGSHKMSSIDHLHSETEKQQVEDHMNLIFAQYVVHGLHTQDVCHHITMMDHQPREMNETLFTMLPLLAITNKDTPHAIHFIWQYSNRQRVTEY